LSEAEKMGFKRAVIPVGNRNSMTRRSALEIAATETAQDALSAVLR
jgi:predicted ATP-dependent serine protease